MKELDVRTMACPGPVIELKKMLEAGEREIVLQVADELARSNVSRFASTYGATAISAEDPRGGFRVTVTADSTVSGKVRGSDPEAFCDLEEGASPGAGPMVVQVSSSAMGSGDDDLGELLLRSFVKTWIQHDRGPDTMLFYNSGVHLCCDGSPLLQDLRDLEGAGVELLACGTCLSFFEKAEALRVGRVTDMLEIVTRLAGAGKIVRP